MSLHCPFQDFVINTIDRPLGLNLEPSGEDAPVFRFCKTKSHADILIPIYHFHMKRYDKDFLERVPYINKTFTCEKAKLPVRCVAKYLSIWSHCCMNR